MCTAVTEEPGKLTKLDYQPEREQVAGLLAVAGHQLDEPLCVSAGLAIVRDRLLGLCNRDILVLEDVWLHPASDHILVRLDRVLTQGKAGVEECSIVAAGGVQIGNQPDQAVTVDVAKAGLEIAPGRSCLSLAGICHRLVSPHSYYVDCRAGYIQTQRTDSSICRPSPDKAPCAGPSLTHPSA